MNKYSYKMMSAISKFSVLLLTITFLAACGANHPTGTNPGKTSTTTGLAYNEEGFQVNKYTGQLVGPNMVLIEGGRATVGAIEEDVLFSRDNLERTITVASFYMDETEIANIHWLEYLYYLSIDSAQEVYNAALPDTTVWAMELSFNEPYVSQYLRYPGFRYYPVVGVSWEQANHFCQWRTNVVNLKHAVDAGLEDMLAEDGTVPLSTGVALLGYRLPTEAEWEYAAQAMIGTQYNVEIQENKRIYPWDGRSLRNPWGRQQGNFLANFKRGKGDYAGIAGHLNDGSMITAQVYEYPPNDFGLYNMAGNVSEWVYDIYRPLSFQDFEDLNPVRDSEYFDPESGYDTQNFNSLVSNQVRVYKGGSWKDVAYWLATGTRRFLEQDSATAMIGFRCVMSKAGPN